jgi:hypothetical protein
MCFTKTLSESPIFKLPCRASNLCMQVGFIEQINDMELCGIGFELVWSDEVDPVRKVIFPPRDQPFRKRQWWCR